MPKEIELWIGSGTVAKGAHAFEGSISTSFTKREIGQNPILLLEKKVDNSEKVRVIVSEVPWSLKSFNWVKEDPDDGFTRVMFGGVESAVIKMIFDFNDSPLSLNDVM